jgi:hypothetical protein
MHEVGVFLLGKSYQRAGQQIANVTLFYFLFPFEGTGVFQRSLVPRIGSREKAGFVARMTQKTCFGSCHGKRQLSLPILQGNDPG